MRKIGSGCVHSGCVCKGECCPRCSSSQQVQVSFVGVKWGVDAFEGCKMLVVGLCSAVRSSMCV